MYASAVVAGKKCRRNLMISKESTLMKPIFIVVPIAAVLLSACTTVPTSPSMLALPGSTKTFEQFRSDDAMCRDYAYRSNPTDDVDRGVRSAAIGTLIGAAAGGAIGGQHGAAIGAGGGLIVGSAVGSDQADRSNYGMQRRYDNAYIQCMYAQGHKVPVTSSGFTSTPYRPSYQTPPPPNSPPPPNMRPPY